MGRTGKEQPAGIRWLDHLGVTGTLRDDLAAFVGDSGDSATLRRLSAHGPAVIAPLLTVAPISQGAGAPARESALWVVREVGQPAVPVLIALLDAPIAQAYDRSVGDGRWNSMQAFYFALEGLAEAASSIDCAWLPAIRAVAEPWIDVADGRLSSAARAAWVAAERNLAILRHDTQAMVNPVPPRGDAASTKWGRDEAAREAALARRIEEEAVQRQLDKALHDAAAAWFLASMAKNR